MLSAFVLRLHRDALRNGVIAGEVEDVAGGNRSVLRCVDDLLAFLAQAASTSPAPAADQS